MSKRRSFRSSGLVLLLTTIVAIPLQAQDVRIRGFSDIIFVASDDPEVNSAFSLGELDLYMTSDLSDRISFTGELVFEYADAVVADVERVGLRFLVSNRLNLVFGKHHTPIGAWNTSFHHGSLLQPTISRPLIFLFEDQGGVLPVHTTGLWAWGNLPRQFTYDIMLGNGIGSDLVSDNDMQKSLTLSINRGVTSRLRVGVTGYLDHISAGTLSHRSTDALPVLVQDDVAHRMLAGNVVLRDRNLEMMAEFLVLNNRTDRATTRSTGMYAYGGYQVGVLTPYVRYDRLSFGAGDPYLPSEDVEQFLMGLRHDLDPMVSARLELRNQRKGGENVRSLVFQVAFAF